MRIDPYALCPCGSGKKLKWCCSTILPEVERVIALIDNNQAEIALSKLEKLASDSTNPPYVQVLKAQAQASFGDVDAAFVLIEKTIEENPTFALAREVRADFLFVQDDYAEALDGFLDALAHYSPDATTQLARTLLKAGNCQNYQGRPIAAWAAWQKALKIDANFTSAQEAIDQLFKENPLLTNRARQGLSLKSPDELAVFNEVRDQKWHEAMARQDDWQLDDLVALYEYLAKDDPYDQAAWYNLGITSAWAGDNEQAIEALDHYVKHEDDMELAADAWDLCELLRLGVGAEDFSDNVQHVAVYDVPDPTPFFEQLKKSKNAVIMSAPDGTRSLHWMSTPLETTGSASPVFSAAAKHLAQITIYEGRVEVVATQEDQLARMKVDFEPLAGQTAIPVGVFQRPGNIQTIDAEPLLTVQLSARNSGDWGAAMENGVRHYFEDEWIHRPLKALDGLTPVDAAGSSILRKKLEGVVRFRERNFARYDVPYNFDRLRNKLGLQPSHPDPGEDAGSHPRDISAMPASQLAELVPSKLNDEELVAAYRSAISLDAVQNSLQFGAELLKRDSVAGKIDMTLVVRRMVLEALEAGSVERARALIEEGRSYDTGHYASAHRREYEAMTARLHLADGATEAACELFRKLFDENPDDLEIVAQATEHLLTGGDYKPALEFAERGLQRAESLQAPEFQEQFREYLHAAGARV